MGAGMTKTARTVPGRDDPSPNGARSGSGPSGGGREGPSRLTRGDIVRRVAITLAVLACIGLLIVAVQRADTGEPDVPQAGDPTVVEFLVPEANSEVLQQSNVAADLAAGWTGVLVVNGTEIPEDELRREAGQNIVEFQPGPGLVIEQLPPGRNCARVIVWRVNETRARARQPVEWCFEVT
jgi:hypothetical protein